MNWKDETVWKEEKKCTLMNLYRNKQTIGIL